jgi:hypothetical protein
MNEKAQFKVALNRCKSDRITVTTTKTSGFDVCDQPLLLYYMFRSHKDTNIKPGIFVVVTVILSLLHIVIQDPYHEESTKQMFKYTIIIIC